MKRMRPTTAPTTAWAILGMTGRITVPVGSDMADTVDEKLIAYAQRRYDNDAEFHAKANMAANLALIARRPEGHAVDDWGMAVTAAALGLAMEWVDPATGKILDS